MTMMAEINPALFRLFERIDNAPNPRNEDLSALMELWRDARSGAVIPSLADFSAEPDAGGTPAFCLFGVLADEGRDYELRRGNGEIEHLLGTRAAGTRLKRAPARRAAVRLRRLLDVVRASGEPVMARFESRGAGAEWRITEILVLPLSEDGRSVSAFACGLTHRAVAAPPSRSTRRRRVRMDAIIVALERDRPFATAVAARLGVDLAPLEERNFEDGEHKIRPMFDPRNRDVVLVAGLNAGDGESVNDRLCRMLFLVACLRTNNAASVSVVAPYLCYMRKDRQTKARDPLTGRYVAQLIEAMGADRLVTMEAHNLAAFQNAFRIPTMHLDPYSAFAEALQPHLHGADVTVMSPDLGGSKRADLFREELQRRLDRPVGAALMEKHRSLGVVSGDLFAGEVKDRTVVILDDMISSGTTMLRAAEACRTQGARDVYLATSHGLFSAEAGEKLVGGLIRKIFIANTIQPSRVPSILSNRVVTVDVSGMFADCIEGFCR